MSDPTSLPNFPPPADEHPLRGRVLDVLKDLGLNPNIDGDGDVAFMIGEPPQQLFVRCLDGDWPVMRIFGQWLIGEQVPDDLYLRLQGRGMTAPTIQSLPTCTAAGQTGCLVPCPGCGNGMVEFPETCDTSAAALRAVR